jgi:hypothetical protein
MGHFKIYLGSGIQADVRYGRIMRKMINFRDLFRGRHRDRVERMGYIVKPDAVHGAVKEYRFLRSMEGVWVKEDCGAFQATEEDELGIEIKKGIEEYERRIF